MINLTLEGLENKIELIKHAYPKNDLGVASKLWDETLSEYFGMKLSAHLVTTSMLCTCRHYTNRQNDSGAIVLIGLDPKYSHIGSASYFYGNFWFPDELRSRDSIKMNSTCKDMSILCSLPDSVNQFYFPKNVFPYLLENWKKISLDSILQNSQMNRREIGIEIPIK